MSKARSSAHVAPEGAPPQKELLSEKPPESSMTLELEYRDMRDYLITDGGWGVLRFRIAPACK